MKRKGYLMSKPLHQLVMEDYRRTRFSKLFISAAENADLKDESASWAKHQNGATRPDFEDAVAILVDAMLASPSDEQLQTRALISLKRMAQEQSKRSFLGQSGCIQTAITAMRTFPENISLLLKGSQFVANVSFNCPDNQKRVCECRGVELLLALMARHGGNDDLQCFVCLALRNLTQQSDAVRRECVMAGSLEAIQSCLKRFVFNKDLQVQGIATIGNLASYSLETQKRLRDCGCIAVTIEAMRRHPSSMSVQQNGVYALMHISYKNETNQREIEQLGGVEILTELMRRHQQNCALIVNICSTLRYMCFVEEVRGKLGQNGCLILMIESLNLVMEKGKREDAELVLKALSNATFSPAENKRIISQCGGIQAVLGMLERHKDNPDVLAGGLRVFRNIIDRGGVIYQLLSDAHVFSFAMSRAEHFHGHEEISEHFFALILYATAIRFEEDKVERKLEELRSFIAQQLHRLPESVNVQKLGRELSAHLEYLEKASISSSITGDKKGIKKLLFRR